MSEIDSIESRLRRHRSILNAFRGESWAIQEDKLEAIAAVIEHRIAIGKFTDAEIRSRLQAITIEGRSGSGRGGVGGQPTKEKIAVIPVSGTIVNRAGLYSDWSGGASTETIGKYFDEAMNDASVSTVLLDIDSPGGSVFGVQELSDKIYNARDKGKRIIAHVNPLAASAAYWIASAANEITMTPSGEAGSIGVFAVHADYSKALEEEGIKHTLIKAGKYKAEGTNFEPLSDDAKEYLQSRVDSIYQKFLSSVARNRGITVADVEKKFGQGRTLGADQAVSVGMVDRLQTWDDLIESLGVGSGGSMRAAGQPTTETKISNVEKWKWRFGK